MWLKEAMPRMVNIHHLSSSLFLLWATMFLELQNTGVTKLFKDYISISARLVYDCAMSNIMS